MNFFKRFLVRKTLIQLPEKSTRDNWHEGFIIHLASIIRPKTYVELGLYQCELFNRVLPFTETAIGVDISEKAGVFMKRKENTHFFCQTTAEFALTAKEMSLEIDMLFIDADHSKKWVRHDFDAFFPLMNEHGIILLHDSFPKNKEFTNPGFCGDGYKAVEELTKLPGAYEMMTIPVHLGLTICRKAKNHLPWN